MRTQDTHASTHRISVAARLSIAVARVLAGLIVLATPAVAATPSVASLSPTSGPTAGGTSISATSPAENAGTVNVSVTTSAGRSTATRADEFTYKMGSPTVLVVSPDAGGTAGKVAVTIRGAGLSGAVKVDFGKIPTANFTVHSATSITATAPVARPPALSTSRSPPEREPPR
jgi:IPT/TIG domain